MHYSEFLLRAIDIFCKSMRRPVDVFWRAFY